MSEYIREGLARPICELCGLTEQNECDISEGGCVELAECLDGQVDFLRSEGLVRKVKSELPLQWVCPHCNRKFDLCEEGLDKAGYVAIIPLVEAKP